MANATISTLKSLYATPSRHRDARTETLSPLQTRAHALRRELAAVNAAEAAIDVPADREYEATIQQVQKFLTRTEGMFAGLRQAATSMRAGLAVLEAEPTLAHTAVVVPPIDRLLEAAS
jgi:hypothetical protein